MNFTITVNKISTKFVTGELDIYDLKPRPKPKLKSKKVNGESKSQNRTLNYEVLSIHELDVSDEFVAMYIIAAQERKNTMPWLRDGWVIQYDIKEDKNVN